MKCQINNGGYLQLRSFTFFALHDLYSVPFWTLLAVPKLWFLHSCLCYRHLGSNGPNDKHSVEEQFWHLAFATWTGLFVRLARIGWLPSQANLPLHGGWHRNRKTVTGHEMSNHQSKKSFPMKCQVNNGGYLQFRSFTLFCTTRSLLSTILEPASWQLPLL